MVGLQYQGFSPFLSWQTAWQQAERHDEKKLKVLNLDLHAAQRDHVPHREWLEHMRPQNMPHSVTISPTRPHLLQ